MATFKSLAVMLLVTKVFIEGAEITIQKNTIKVDYTHCKSETPVPKDCTTQGEPGSQCFCYFKFNLTEAIAGPITVYYELPDFNQTRATYANSFDAEQLAGHLSKNVSSNCGDFSYDAEKRPIAPCGEIADSYFSDIFNLFADWIDSQHPIPFTGTDLDGIPEIKKKKNYQNPSGDLKTAFQNFTNPINWYYSKLTELDRIDQNNTGFQNERFIAWMQTDMNIKPALRLHNTGMANDGLAPGNYFFRITCHYSPYITGRRIAYISSEKLATKALKDAERVRAGDSTHSTDNQVINRAMPVWAFLAIDHSAYILGPRIAYISSETHAELARAGDSTHSTDNQVNNRAMPGTREPIINLYMFSNSTIYINTL